MYATKIKMRFGCGSSNNLTEIDEIYLIGSTNERFYKKEVLHDHLINHSNSIQVNISPYPYLVPATSYKGEKYVKSTPNSTTNDNLLSLPRV
ncbi:MAG: DUF3892 domain-containing protein [Desulfosporosinus sp.]|nr:DUF3892 domain-containing protein [Desulfosporosinus sp.]